jgi:uncharacterized SAM-binding protein YcdF (DUF218 family)
MTGRQNVSGRHHRTAGQALTKRRWAAFPWRIFAITFGASLALLAIGFAEFVVTSPERPANRDEMADGIVVLTGGPARIDEALNLLWQHRGRRLLITGVHPHTSERRLSQLSGRVELFDCCVDIGHQAADTRGNAEEAKSWAEQNNFRRLIIVTSDYHMARAMLEFTRRMPDVVLIPWPVAGPPELPGPPAIARARMWIAEYVKFLYALTTRPTPEA